MASSLSLQLSQIAAKSVDSLNLRAQKASHSKSLIFEPRIAASQSFDSLFILCYEGFEELCLLDNRFSDYRTDLFSRQSLGGDRTQLIASQNEQLDHRIESFLRLLGGRLRLNAAIKAAEWLVRRFQIHQYNTPILLTTFLPYHSLPIFITLLSILPSQIPTEYRFLHPYIRSLSNPPRHVIVHAATNNVQFATRLNSYILCVCKAQQHYAALLAFWAGIMSEATSGMLDKARSGRLSVELQNERDVTLKLLPMLNEGLSSRGAPELQIGCYMLLSIMASKGGLDDKLLNSMMEAIVLGWTSETITPGLVCLSVLAQQREAKQFPRRLTHQLVKVPNLPHQIAQISKSRRVDRLANGLCLSLVSRFSKKGDKKELIILSQFIESGILKDTQVKVIMKALLLTAFAANDQADSKEFKREELALCFSRLSQLESRHNGAIRAAFLETEVDIDELEMKLRIARQPLKIQAPSNNVVVEIAVDSEQDPGPSFSSLMTKFLHRTAVEVSFLSHDTSHVYTDLCEAFLAASTSISNLDKFDAAPMLLRDSALSDARYLTFYMRFWCGPHPVLARVAALNMATRSLAQKMEHPVDIQATLPYIIVALSDAAEKVRRAAATLLVQVGHRYLAGSPSFSKNSDVVHWAFKEIYGRDTASFAIKWLSIDAAGRFLREILLPSLEECVLDNNHVHFVLAKAMNNAAVTEGSRKGEVPRFSRSSRLAFLSFLASHVVCTPMLVVKLKLLMSLNRVPGVANSTRTKFLLPFLQQWTAFSFDELSTRCDGEKVDPAEMDTLAVGTVVASDKDGVEFLLSIIQGSTDSHRNQLLAAVFHRLRGLWLSLKDDLQLQMASLLLECTQSVPKTDHENMISEQSTSLLDHLELSSTIFLSFLSSIPTIAQLADQAPPIKRRRTSHGEIAKLFLPDTQQLAAILRRVTFVLQLIDGSHPEKHPDLLGALFTILAELQHLKVQAALELAYLQGLVLSSLVSIIDSIKADPATDFDHAAVRADLLVDCVQKTSSPQVQNSALLLIAGLASTAPELVLHSVMPIFTFLGSSVSRQNDDYSAHVIERTIREVIPPLTISLRRKKSNIVAASSELLLSFVTAYEHVPQHRRRGLYNSLIQTLGAENFLFALLAMLVNKYGATNDIKSFATDISGHLSVEIQLTTALKYLDLVVDILNPKPTISTTLLSTAEASTSAPQETAVNELALLPHLLSQKRLITQTSKVLERNEMGAEGVREIYSAMLEKLLRFANTLKNQKNLHSACASVLERLLGLLSVTEFVRSVESLLDKTDLILRRKLLRSLEARLDKENISNVAARTAMLGFLPQLTAIIREATDINLKHVAIVCVDKISEKYGKKDLEAVSAAAETIASKHCLGQEDNRLRVVALLCLASLVDILREGIVSVLPAAIPTCLDLLSASLECNGESETLRNACYTFTSAHAHHLPYMMTGKYLENLLALSTRIAETDQNNQSEMIQSQCLLLIAKQSDAKNMFTALENNWTGAVIAGPKALNLYLRILDTAVDTHARNVVTKYSDLLTRILQHGFDSKRLSAVSKKDINPSNMFVANEHSFNAIALKIIYKFNDSVFRPIFSALIGWATQTTLLHEHERIWRLQSLYGFLELFFGDLKSIVTSYAALLVNNAVDVIQATDLKDEAHEVLWTKVLRTLRQCFEHDRDSFWQAPSHFNAIAPLLCAQFTHASKLPVVRDLIPVVVELAAAADSADHQKEINSAVLKHLRSNTASSRLAAVKCQQALIDRLGEDWLTLLPEMLPFISELQEDDDEVVEKETHRWIIKIEGVLGESLDAMLQ